MGGGGLKVAQGALALGLFCFLAFVGIFSTVYGVFFFYKVLIVLWMAAYLLSRQIYAVPDLCCIVPRRLVESVGGVTSNSVF